MRHIFRSQDNHQTAAYPAIITGICGISILGWLMRFSDPDRISNIIVFFSVLFLTAASFSFAITNIVRRSILIGSGVFGFFFLRYIGLREPLYVILLVACLISLELSMQNP